VPFTIKYLDGAGEGFNDPTLGAQRKAAFEFTVGIWSAMLQGTVPVVINAQFDPLGGSATSAILGQAGATTIHRDFPGAPRAGTWYAAPLANELAASDLNGAGTAEIVFIAVFSAGNDLKPFDNTVHARALNEQGE